MAELAGGTTIGGYLALHSGMSDIPVGGNLTVKGRIYMGLTDSTGGIYGRDNMKILIDHNNGNVTLSATGGQLYLGYTNTTGVRIQQPLYGNDGTTKIAHTDGTLYHQGSELNSIFLYSYGSTMNAGSLRFAEQNEGIEFTHVANSATPVSRSNYSIGAITGGADYAGLGKMNNVAVQTWYGFSVSPTITTGAVPVGKPAFSVNARTGDSHVYGQVIIGPSTPSYLQSQADGSLRVSTGNGYIDIGPKNTTWSHVYTDRNAFYFNKGATFTGDMNVSGGSMSATGQPYLFAYHATAISAPRTTWTIICDGGTASTNVGGGTFSGGQYTVPETGKYAVYGFTTCSSTGGEQYYLACFVNNGLANENRIITRRAAGAGDGQIMGGTIVNVSAGTKLDVRLYHTLSTNQSFTYATVQILKLS